MQSGREPQSCANTLTLFFFPRAVHWLRSGCHQVPHPHPMQQGFNMAFQNPAQLCSPLAVLHRAVSCAVVLCCVAGEELTYDYRFTGEEKLRCNCGAPSCHGWVNKPSSFDSPRRPTNGSLWVPANQLERLTDAAALAAEAPGPPSRKKLPL